MSIFRSKHGNGHGNSAAYLNDFKSENAFFQRISYTEFFNSVILKIATVAFSQEVYEDELRVAAGNQAVFLLTLPTLLIRVSYCGRLDFLFKFLFTGAEQSSSCVFKMVLFFWRTEQFFVPRSSTLLILVIA